MMSSRMELTLLLLLVITTQIQQSENANCTLHKYNYMYDSGIEITELSFEGLDGGACNLSVTTTSYIEQCLEDIEDIEITNMSCLLNRSSVSPTSTALCMNQTTTVTVESTNFVTVTSTQEVFSQTTLSICPTPSTLLSEVTHDVTPSTVYITQCPDGTPSTKTAISNVAQISILATSGVLICLPITALVIVTYCCARTQQTLKKARNEVKFDHSAQDSIPSRCKNISKTATLNLDNNPAYQVHVQTPLQRNLAYEDTTLTTTLTATLKPQGKEKESQALKNTRELAYEIVPLVSYKPASTTTNVPKSREGPDEHNNLLLQQK